MTATLKTGIVSDIATAVAVGLAYFATCSLGLSLDTTSGVGSVWPASGLLMGLLFLADRERWVAIGAGAFLGGLAANLNVGFNSLASVGYVLINLGESFGGNWLLRRYAPDATRLRQPADVVTLFACCAVVAVSAGAPIAAALAALVSHREFWTVWRTWLAADASGVVIVAPAVLLASSFYANMSGPWRLNRVVEAVAMVAGAAALSWWIFLVPHANAWTPLAQPFPLLPFLVWPAIRFGLPATAWSVLVINVFCVWGTHLGLGPFASTDALLAHLSVQAFACMVSVVSLCLATSVDSARRSALLHRELAIRLQSAGEAERSRLAHELHDDIAQKLAALKIQLELDQLLSADRSRTVADSVEQVDGLIGDVRELSRSLRPAPFEEGQLIPALTTLAKSEGRRAGLRVLVDTPSDDVPLSREAELACYRVVREAVINIVKHARAHHLAVSALRHAHFFSVRIVDDGAGFDVGPAARQAVLDGHLGLVGMQERLEQVGGTLKIRSRRGGGTMVECRVPLVATV